MGGGTKDREMSNVSPAESALPVVNVCSCEALGMRRMSGLIISRKFQLICRYRCMFVLVISQVNQESENQQKNRKRKWKWKCGEEIVIEQEDGEGLVVMLARCKHTVVSFDIRFTVVQILLNLSSYSCCCCCCWHVVGAVMTDRLTDWLMSDINPSVCNYYISVEYIDICGPSLISATEPGQHSGLRHTDVE